MKVGEYVERGLKNLVDQAPEGYQQLSKARSGCHVVEAYVRKDGDRIEDIKFKVTKRCKKLLAVADYAAEKIRQTGKLEFDHQEILEFFGDEKEKDKLLDRINLVRSAIGQGKD